MPTMNKIGKHNTKVWGDGMSIIVSLYSTEIVRIFPDSIYLNTGGHYTNTTKTRMNQVSNYFNLGYHVYQKKGQWYAEYNNYTYPFSVQGRCIITNEVDQGVTNG